MVEETVVTRKRSRQQLLEIPKEIPDFDAIDTVNETVEEMEQNDIVQKIKTVKKIDTSAYDNKENFVMSNAETQEQSTMQAIAKIEQKIYGEPTEKWFVNNSDLLMAQRNILYASFFDSIKKDQALQKMKMQRKE